MKHIKLFASVCLMALLFSLAGCDPWKEDTQLKDARYGQPLSETLAAQSQLSEFAALVSAAGYDEILGKAAAMTVFAPANGKLPSFNQNDTAAIKAWVENHISVMEYYTDVNGNLTLNGDSVSRIQMFNGKYAEITKSMIQQGNIPAANGVIHILNESIPYRKNIMEYLGSINEKFEQIDCISSYTERVMDMNKSVQTGLDPKTGQPIYDTVWAEENTFLDQYPLDDEHETFTLVLLRQQPLDSVKAKYGKYMKQPDSLQTLIDISAEVTRDMVFPYFTLDNPGRYFDCNDVLVDLNPSDIESSYKASNGMVYIMKEASVKIYENKIKTTYIEGEDFVETYDAQGAWFVRSRSNYARGGYDIMLKAQTSWTHTWFNYYAENDSTATLTKTGTYNDGDQTSYLLSKTNNAYAKYNPLMYSCTYNLYWVTYNDLSSQYYTIPKVDGVTQRVLKAAGDTVEITDDNRNWPITQEQKLLISFPGCSVLKYSSGAVHNNFSDYACFASAVLAGDQSEHQIVRYRLVDTNNTTSSATYHYFLLDVPYDGKPDAFGDATNLICPYYGNATFFVAGTVRNTDKNAGMVFLDYIKLVPQVDVND